MNNKMWNWFNERYKIDSLREFAQKKSVPLHSATIWYYFGGITLFLFGVQVLTGIFLLLYYRPGVDTAFESVKFIITKVKFGWLIRSVHSWSANLMVASAIIHMFSVFFHRSYRKPRELSWVTGVIMLCLLLTFGFSGYLLPWNELAFFATKVGTDSARAVPFIGDMALRLMRGGADVTGATLARFFGLHISILPIVFAVVLGVHLFFVQLQGMSKPLGHSRDDGKKRSMPFVPDFFLRDLIVWMVVFNIVLMLAVFFPWELGVKADPFSPAPAGIKPEWYFLFVFQSLKFLPAHIGLFEGEMVGIMALGLVGLAIILLPWLDRAASRERRSRWLDAIGVFVLLYFAVFTILGYVLD